MEDPLLACLRPGAESHHGIIRITEAQAAGLSRARRRTLVGRGLLVPIGARGFRIAGAPRTGRQRLLEGCVEVDGVATGRSAVALHGISGFELDAPVEVLVRDGRQSARATLARVHTTTWLPPEDLVVVDGIPTVGVARALFSLAALAAEVGIDAVGVAVDEAVRTGLATDAWLWWRLERLRRRGRNGVTVFEAVLTERADSPTESWLERESLRIWRDAGVPLPTCQERVEAHGAFVARVDFRYPGTTAIIEVSGHRHHAAREQLRRDAKRRRALVASGYEVYDFTYDEVVREPHLLVATAVAILDRRDAAAVRG